MERDPSFDSQQEKQSSATEDPFKLFLQDEIPLSEEKAGSLKTQFDSFYEDLATIDDLLVEERIQNLTVSELEEAYANSPSVEVEAQSQTATLADEAKIDAENQKKTVIATATGMASTAFAAMSGNLNQKVTNTEQSTEQSSAFTGGTLKKKMIATALISNVAGVVMGVGGMKAWEMAGDALQKREKSLEISTAVHFPEPEPLLSPKSVLAAPSNMKEKLAVSEVVKVPLVIENLTMNGDVAQEKKETPERKENFVIEHEEELPMAVFSQQDVLHPEKTQKDMPENETSDSKRKTRYFLQVASCVSQECVEGYRTRLRQIDPSLPIQVIPNTITEQIIEVISRETHREEQTANLIREINQNRYIQGRAFRKLEGTDYRISMGDFLKLDVANRMALQLNQLYYDKARFAAIPTERKIQRYRIRVGGTETRKEILATQTKLQQQDSQFTNSFVVITNH